MLHSCPALKSSLPKRPLCVLAFQKLWGEAGRKPNGYICTQVPFFSFYFLEQEEYVYANTSHNKTRIWHQFLLIWSG